MLYSWLYYFCLNKSCWPYVLTLKYITNWKFLDVEYYDLVRLVEEGLHLIYDGLHRNSSEYSMIRPPHRISIGVMSDSDVEISNSVDQLREHVYILQFNYPNDYQQRLFHI